MHNDLPTRTLYILDDQAARLHIRNARTNTPIIREMSLTELIRASHFRPPTFSREAVVTPKVPRK